MGKSVNVQKWEDMCRQYGCVVSREVPVQIHHIKGRKFKLKHNFETLLVGPWLIIPLAPRYHDVHSNNPHNVTHHKKAFEAEFGTQVELFFQMMNALTEQGKEIPVPDEVIDAIAGMELPW